MTITSSLRRPRRLAALAAAGGVTMLAAFTAAPAQADVEQGPENGVRIYLSQACHNRGGPECQPNVGCFGYDENAGSAAIARAAAGHLAARGYRVRIGDGLTEANISNSNAFGAVIHIPIHSNAGTEDCASTNPARGGTHVLHYGGPGDDQLAGIMAQEVGAKSPGTSDRTVVRTDLGEITDTNARAAYLESAFHTFGADVEFLRNPDGWSDRIAEAVDRCLGAPRDGALTREKECTW